MTDPAGYFTTVSDEHRRQFAAWADVCRHGRDAYFRSNAAGFDANPGSEAETCKRASLANTWPGGAWPDPGPGDMLHQVGLMLANSAAGRLGELGALLDQGEVFWSLPMHARGVMEICARLFRIYMQPFLASAGTPSDEEMKVMYATAHFEIISSAFSAKKVAEAFLALDPGDADREAQLAHVDAEIDRLVAAYGPHYDPALTKTDRASTLMLGGVVAANMTDLVDSFAAWTWPDPKVRPRPLYRVFSGHGHTSLDADMELYRVEDVDGRRVMTRLLDDGFVETFVLTALAMFHRTFARIVGFYGWDETTLDGFAEHIAAEFPDGFTLR